MKGVLLLRVQRYVLQRYNAVHVVIRVTSGCNCTRPHCGYLTSLLPVRRLRACRVPCLQVHCLSLYKRNLQTTQWVICLHINFIEHTRNALSNYVTSCVRGMYLSCRVEYSVNSINKVNELTFYVHVFTLFYDMQQSRASMLSLGKVHPTYSTM